MPNPRKSAKLRDSKRIDEITALLLDRVVQEIVGRGEPPSPEVVHKVIERIEEALLEGVTKDKLPADYGLSQLIGLGEQAAKELKDAYLPLGTIQFDETVTMERIQSVGDLYYIYQHEKLGVFRVVLKLKELFKAGAVRLSTGKGATQLYQYDRKQVLRYTHRDRLQAYRRVFGYTKVVPPPGAKPNNEFHSLFVNFMTRVAQFFRDKRVSEVIKKKGDDPSFGSIAIVRRAGLDIRNNLKTASYGHVGVLRVEVQQLLDNAFHILDSDDVRNLFGVESGWDVIEEIMTRYLKVPHVNISQRRNMAVAGRNVLHWLSSNHLNPRTRDEIISEDGRKRRTEFESLLEEIATDAEEWLTSAEGLGIIPPQRVVLAKKKRGRTITAKKRARETEWDPELW